MGTVLFPSFRNSEVITKCHDMFGIILTQLPSNNNNCTVCCRWVNLICNDPLALPRCLDRDVKVLPLGAGDDADVAAGVGGLEAADAEDGVAA